MSEISEMIERLQDNEAIFAIWLTEFCNFECAHCFHGCTPEGDKEYISDDILEKILEMCDIFHEMDLRTEVSLIGGEPTADLDRYQEILEMVWDWVGEDGSTVFTSTNGWWLHKRKTLEKFLDIISYCLGEENFSVRISNDNYHDEFRPKYFKGRIASIWESVKMGHAEYDKEIDYPFNFPFGEEECGVFVDSHIQDCYVIPSGGRGTWGYNDYGLNCGTDGCHSADTLTFSTKGELIDGCCKGSYMPFGDVNDHPLLLLMLIRDFKDRYKPACVECRDKAKEYVENDLEDARNKFSEMVNNHLETIEGE